MLGQTAKAAVVVAVSLMGGQVFAQRTANTPRPAALRMQEPQQNSDATPQQQAEQKLRRIMDGFFLNGSPRAEWFSLTKRQVAYFFQVRKMIRSAMNNGNYDAAIHMAEDSLNTVHLLRRSEGDENYGSSFDAWPEPSSTTDTTVER